jgi:hypothetical protein
MLRHYSLKEFGITGSCFRLAYLTITGTLPYFFISVASKRVSNFCKWFGINTCGYLCKC